MIIIGLILSVFFILVIVLLCRTYTKDIFELENRVLQLEKRIVDFRREQYSYDKVQASAFHDLKDMVKELYGKEGDGKMACKGKGKGGKRK